IYELLSNVTDYFGKSSPFELASIFHRLEPGKPTCNSELTIFNFRFKEWSAQPSQKELRCLYRDPSLSFSKCNVDPPCNKYPGLIDKPFSKLRLFCLILLTINVYQ
ncbi:hypothetical protein PHET_11266, partial [Paragonimus heterotremus]